MSDAAQPARSARGFVVALLGAESTGKTTLALALRDALAPALPGSVVVREYLREFCDRHGRTPLAHEQPAIAATQTARIDAAARAHELVIADTTALMIAVYSDHVFGDTTLYAQAEAAQARVDLTLVTGLDLPWRADGLQRDGAHVREPVDARLRAALARAAVPYSVVFGSGAARVDAALACVQRALGPAPAAPTGGDDGVRWHWRCERCGDPQCDVHARRVRRAILPTR